MKISYNKEHRFVISWWDETGAGNEDTIYPDEEDIKGICDLPEYASPDALEYPITCYKVNNQEKLIEIEKETLHFKVAAHAKESYQSKIANAIDTIDDAAENVRN